MKIAIIITLLAIVIGLLGFSRTSMVGTAQSDVDPTVEALETKVANLEATIASLTTTEEADSEPTSRAATEEVDPPAENQADRESSTAVQPEASITTEVWTVTIKDFELRESIDLYETFTARGIYLLATLSVANLTYLPFEFPYERLSVQDGAGRQYEYQDTITANLLNDRYDPLYEYSLLQPGLTYETVVVFEISDESDDLVLSLDDDSSNPNREAERAASEALAAALPTGSTVEYRGWEMTITGSERVDTLSSIFGDHSALGSYIVVSLTVTNSGNAPDYFPYEEVRLVDGDGRWFSFIMSPTDGLSLELTDQQYWEQLQAGIPYDIAIVFDTPPDVGGLVFVPSFEQPEIAVTVED